MKIDFARELALKSLYKIEEKKAYSNKILDEIINNNKDKLNAKDIGLISQIVYGTLSWRLTLDTIIQKYSKIKIKKMSIWVINILRMGAYQIIFLDKIPKSAAVNESVNIAKKYSTKSSGFINAILRKIDTKDYEELEKIEDKIENISKTTSTPDWIVKELLKQSDLKTTKEICISNNIKPKITIRINKLKCNIEQIIEQFEKEKIEYTVLNDNFIRIKKCKRY